jgi:hypothetical protein
LARKGYYYCDVTAHGGRVTVIIDKNVIRLEPLAGELRAIVGAMDGVEKVETKVGPEFNQPDIVHSYDFEIPSRITARRPRAGLRECDLGEARETRYPI